MEEVKKKMNWKKIVIVSVAIVLLLAIGVIIWTETLWYCVARDVFVKGNVTGGSINNRGQTTQVTDRVRVYISWNDREDFYAQKYTKQDFKWANVKEIEYREDPCQIGPDFWHSYYVEAYILVYLKIPGEYNCKKAILHFEMLDFVSVSIFDDDIENRELLVWTPNR